MRTFMKARRLTERLFSPRTPSPSGFLSPRILSIARGSREDLERIARGSGVEDSVVAARGGREGHWPSTDREFLLYVTCSITRVHEQASATHANESRPCTLIDSQPTPRPPLSRRIACSDPQECGFSACNSQPAPSR